MKESEYKTKTVRKLLNEVEEESAEELHNSLKGITLHWQLKANPPSMISDSFYPINAVTTLDFPRNSILRVLFAKSEPKKCSFTLSKLRFFRT